MSFSQIFTGGIPLILGYVSVLWLLSVRLKNASIVDIFWGLGFILLAVYYYFNADGLEIRKIITLLLVSIWGLRLSIYIGIRNWGKPEDYRYQAFRQRYGAQRYWWFSFFQVFLLQGALIWIISAPLLAAMYYSPSADLGWFDFIGIAFWMLGFFFESVGDYQMARFKANPGNKGKVMNNGLWKYTRHPNYFGDASVWWGFALLSLATGALLPVISSVLMTWLIIRISGVSLLEESLIKAKPHYKAYIESTSAFIPWFPKSSKK
jgi:steroid 5-alpha reductase family enzyme